MTERRTETIAVVLCGGQGTRMGSLTRETPKSMLSVQGRPILWYILGRMYLAGIGRFVLPIGYLGLTIAEYVEREFAGLGCEILCVDTGVDSPIGHRLDRVRHLLPDDGDFVLANGDALFDFDLAAMIERHDRAAAAITFATVETISKYGLVVMDGEQVAGFERRSRVAGYFVAAADGLARARVYAGIAVMRKEALDAIDLAAAENFEAELFPTLVRGSRTAHFPIPGFWYSIDTPKDLAAADDGAGSDPAVAGPVAGLKESIERALMAAGKAADRR